MTSWAVVTTARCPQHDIERFVRHYKWLGASEVFIFYDDANFAWHINEPNVITKVCGHKWFSFNRPEALEIRQRHNATKGLRWTKAEWIMHCDIDELLATSSGTVSDVLSSMPDKVGGVMVRPVEAVYLFPPEEKDIYRTPFFKRFWSSSDQPSVYDAISKKIYSGHYYLTKSGFFGHINGKSFVRKQSGIKRMPLHHVNSSVSPLEMRHMEPRFTLRHYDTTNYGRWKDKHIRRINGEVAVSVPGRFRERQSEFIAHCLETRGEDGLVEAHKIFSTLSEENLIFGINGGFIHVIPSESHLL